MLYKNLIMFMLYKSLMKIVVYCLNCDPYRKIHMIDQFKKNNINDYHFFNALNIQEYKNYKNIISPIQDNEDKIFLSNFDNVAPPKDLRSAQVSISLGHYFITKKFIESDNDILIFCEDDIVLMDNNITETISSYIEKENIMDKPFMIYGCHLSKNVQKNEHKLIRTNSQYGNPCYIINKHSAKIFLTNFCPITAPYDDYLKHLKYKNKNILCYYTSPFLCYELSSRYYEMYYSPEDHITKQRITRASSINIRDYVYTDIKYNPLSNDNFWCSLREHILQKKLKKSYKQTNDTSVEHLLFGGSIEYSNTHSIICGSGIKNQTDSIMEPHMVISCRGPLTRKKIMDCGYFCPENYGDPGLLISHFYPIHDNEKTHKIAIILSNDKIMYAPNNEKSNTWASPAISSLQRGNTCMLLTFDDMDYLINGINKCEYVISDSLYGIIIAHSYGIPSIWVNSDDKTISNTDNTEILDYYQSLDIFNVIPLILNDDLIVNIDNYASTYPNPTYKKIVETINNIRKWSP
jgi:pyruvyltransferase